MSTDIEALNKEATASATLPAAKLHVLQLEPIKEKIGDRWPRMSLLVHTLFEKALRHAQGPQDHFIKVGELSYVVTFHGSTPEEAAIACTGIAREVCEHLFGEGVETASVRSVVGEVSADQLAHDCEAVAELLEQTGLENVVTKSEAGLTSEQQPAQLDANSPGHAMMEAHQFVGQLGRKLGFFPLWDLKKQASSALLLSPLALTGRNGYEPHSIHGSVAAPHGPDGVLAKLELRLLRAAGEYAQRVHASQKVCAVGAGVSYDTLSSLSGRVRYITTLKEIRTSPVCPLLLKIEDIPQGVHLGRLGEIMNMVTVPNVRFLLEFTDRIPEFEFRMGAAGIGAVLPDDCPAWQAESILKSMPNRLLGQHAFGFLRGLHSSPLTRLAAHYDLRFGLGAALDGAHRYTGLEAVPDFPLSA
jgi:hypothetical protein